MTRRRAEPDIYRPPDLSVCDVVEALLLLGAAGTDRLMQRQNVYRGRVVDFCYIQQARRDTSETEWVDIYRMNTSHGTVHEHMLMRGSEVHEIEIIPTGQHDSWDQVTRLADEMFDRFMDLWESRRREWEL